MSHNTQAGRCREARKKERNSILHCRFVTFSHGSNYISIFFFAVETLRWVKIPAGHHLPVHSVAVRSIFMIFLSIVFLCKHSTRTETTFALRYSAVTTATTTKRTRHRNSEIHFFPVWLWSVRMSECVCVHSTFSQMCTRHWQRTNFWLMVHAWWNWCFMFGHWCSVVVGVVIVIVVKIIRQTNSKACTIHNDDNYAAAAAAAGAWAARRRYTAHGWAESVGPSCPTCKCCERQATSYSPSGRTTIFDGINGRTERKYIKTYRFQSSFPLQPLHTTNERTKIIPTPKCVTAEMIQNLTNCFRSFTIHKKTETRNDSIDPTIVPCWCV